MQTLILDDDPQHHTRLTASLMTRGFQVLNAMSIIAGLEIARRGSIDLLVMSEYVAGKLSHKVALSAERRSPAITTILLTQRTDDDLSELYLLLPSLYSILGKSVHADLIAKLGVSGVIGATSQASVAQANLFNRGRWLRSNVATTKTKPLAPLLLT